VSVAARWGRSGPAATRLAIALTAAALLAAAAPPAVATTPSPGDIRRQQAETNRLQQQARDQALTLRGGQRTLAALATAANRALDAYQQAREELLAAEQLVRTTQLRLAAARAAVADARRALNGYAAAAYRSGAGESALQAARVLLDAAPDDLATGLAYVGSAGDGYAATLTLLRRGEAAERQAASAAQGAAALRSAAATAAAAAKSRAAVLVAEQRRLVAALDARLAATSAAAGGRSSKRRRWSAPAGSPKLARGWPCVPRSVRGHRCSPAMPAGAPAPV